MADRGNVGFVKKGPHPITLLGPSFYRSNTISVTATGSNATNDAIVRLSHSSGVDIVEARVSGGSWSFYDMEDGTYYVNEVGSAKAWQIDVVSGVATVTELGGGGTLSYAWV